MWVIAGILVVLGMVIAIRNNKILENDRSMYDQEEPDENKTRQKIALVVLVVALFVVGIVIFIKSGSGGEYSDDGSIAAFVPIWVAVWVPFMNKKKKQPTETQKKILIIILLGTVLAVGLTVWLAAVK